uniref:Uncharacterized protein n=1 Tax=Anguilla anguilla TaxID=7936 RepID=A0A0E9PSD9_ANGAN
MVCFYLGHLFRHLYGNEIFKVLEHVLYRAGNTMVKYLYRMNKKSTIKQ